MSEKPNIVFVFADQWRRSATGFAGNHDVQTPNLDRFAGNAIDFTNAISGCPVCCPARASLLTGAYPHQHGIFVNDVPLGNSHTTLGEAFAGEGYATAYIGKWHLDGHGRSAPIPPDRRKGFQDWWVLECSHDYNRSPYYTGHETTPRVWPGYDAGAQTTCALEYLESRSQAVDPFLLVLSWGPPHNPYDSAPERFRSQYDPSRIHPPPNVPERFLADARRDLAGYYAHCTALDEQFGRLADHLARTGMDKNTILVFWSDHGDQIYSQGEQRKQRPWEESIHVPLLLRWPNGLSASGRKVDAVLNTPDILPTLLDLAGIPIPSTVSGKSHAPHLLGLGPEPSTGAVLACYHPFGEYERRSGGREYRGWRTKSHTYAETLDGPWLLYDNARDPWQIMNLAAATGARSLRETLAAEMRHSLAEIGDDFRPGSDYLKKWGSPVDEHGTVPITD